MEETQSHRQSPSVWGSTQELASWDINDDEKNPPLSQTGKHFILDPIIRVFISAEIAHLLTVKIILKKYYLWWSVIPYKRDCADVCGTVSRTTTFSKPVLFLPIARPVGVGASWPAYLAHTVTQSSLFIKRHKQWWLEQRTSCTAHSPIIGTPGKHE